MQMKFMKCRRHNSIKHISIAVIMPPATLLRYKAGDVMEEENENDQMRLRKKERRLFLPWHLYTGLTTGFRVTHTPHTVL